MIKQMFDHNYVFCKCDRCTDYREHKSDPSPDDRPFRPKRVAVELDGGNTQVFTDPYEFEKWWNKQDYKERKKKVEDANLVGRPVLNLSHIVQGKPWDGLMKWVKYTDENVLSIDDNIEGFRHGCPEEVVEEIIATVEFNCSGNVDTEVLRNRLYRIMMTTGVNRAFLIEHTLSRFRHVINLLMPKYDKLIEQHKDDRNASWELKKERAILTGTRPLVRFLLDTPRYVFWRYKTPGYAVFPTSKRSHAKTKREQWAKLYQLIWDRNVEDLISIPERKPKPETKKRRYMNCTNRRVDQNGRPYKVIGGVVVWERPPFYASGKTHAGAYRERSEKLIKKN